MKRLSSLVALVFSGLLSQAQAPAQINYQGVARNSVGNVIAERDVRLRLTIREGSATGEMVYQETKTMRTSKVGLFTVAIGGPGAVSVYGGLENINWASGATKFLQVEMDPAGGTNYSNMGASQLLSVPYALYAASASPSGTASGDLTGSFPHPAIAAGAVKTEKIANGAITTGKISTAGAEAGQVLYFNGQHIVWAKPEAKPIGNAGGDLAGTYPNPSLAPGAVTTAKLADGSVTSQKLATNSVTTIKIQDAAITSAKLAPGVIPASMAPSGAAGGDLAGSYPNPVLASGSVGSAKLADGAVTGPKLADGSVSAGKINATGVAAGQVLGYDGNTVTWMTPVGGASTGTAGGDLTGVYPSPQIAADAVSTGKLANASVTNPKLADDAVSTSKIQDGAITADKLAPGLVPGGSTPSGSAGGDLSGQYPNPNIASGAITSPKINNGAIITPKLADGAVNTNKLADGAVTGSKISTAGAATGQVLGFDGTNVLWTTPAGGAVAGTAGGDLTGTFPNPLVNKIRGVDVSNTVPASGQVLKFDGTQWAPATDATGQAFDLPYSGIANAAGSLVTVTNSGAGSAIDGINTSVADNSTAIVGRMTATNQGAFSAGLKGVNHGTGTAGIGVYGTHAGKGWGIYGSSASGTGVFGSAANGFGLIGSSVNGTGLYADSKNGNAAFIEITNPQNTSDALLITNGGQGSAISVSSGTGSAIAATSIYAPAVSANSDNANGIEGISSGQDAVGMLGVHTGNGNGAWGVALGTGAGVKASSFTNGGTALEAELDGVSAGNIAIFKKNGTNMARIDHSGKGYFNNGTTNSGADVAETFRVEGAQHVYEPGDVLVISQTTDRTVERSATPYSTLVAGVYATKPGLLLTERNAVEDNLDDMVPMGVIGVIPTKVCLEGGAIKRGDLLVTSSIAGVAMKADPEKVKVGQVLGKALQDYSNSGVGKIKVLVSVK